MIYYMENGKGYISEICDKFEDGSFTIWWGFTEKLHFDTEISKPFYARGARFVDVILISEKEYNTLVGEEKLKWSKYHAVLKRFGFGSGTRKDLKGKEKEWSAFCKQYPTIESVVDLF